MCLSADIIMRLLAIVIITLVILRIGNLANSRGSYPLADLVTSDNTLVQVHSIFVR